MNRNWKVFRTTWLGKNVESSVTFSAQIPQGEKETRQNEMASEEQGRGIFLLGVSSLSINTHWINSSAFFSWTFSYGKQVQLMWLHLQVIFSILFTVLHFISNLFSITILSIYLSILTNFIFYSKLWIEDDRLFRRLSKNKLKFKDSNQKNQ